MSTEYISEVTVLPEGMEQSDDEMRHFAVKAVWRGARQENGSGGFGVTDGFRWLSRAGNWGHPERFQYRQYRWETIEEALVAARAVVDHVRVNGKTWAEWKQSSSEA